VLLAPIGFVAGLVAALTPWPVALLGLVTALLGLFGLRQFQAFFGFGSLAVILLGFVLDAEMMWVVPAAGALALPILAALFTGCKLELPTHDGSRPAPRLRPSG
jgi:hypothetical protein